ncbi:hypothetical protein VT98_11192 [Candidatus Electrothrix communis]|uniref:Uncharacterized protein n=1 Tax=Candidatus Electrothrix communis TaxID=1859133 RepID=A0A444J6N9_9BACT|nr:hypothetical protein [Desulfobulbus sp. US4]RWX48700.1 hypothetical protein VT98_11192 [Candidatus Electrothrix communis]WLE97678.1 MAG: hypothetical protein QTN59_02325 [Candidatus Electrothrix communis]
MHNLNFIGKYAQIAGISRAFPKREVFDKPASKLAYREVQKEMHGDVHGEV